MIQMLLIASSRNWYVIPWRRPCPEPSRRISMKIPHATENPVRNVRSLFFRIVSRISCQVSTSSTGHLEVVLLDEPVLQVHDPVGAGGDVPLVRHDDDRDAGAMDVLEDVHDLERGRGVERAGRLVGEDD